MIDIPEKELWKSPEYEEIKLDKDKKIIEFNKNKGASVMFGEKDLSEEKK